MIATVNPATRNKNASMSRTVRCAEGMVKGHNNTFHVSKLAAVPNIDHRYFGHLSTTRRPPLDYQLLG